MSQTIDYSLDQHEDAVLVSMLSFFLDVGIPDDIDEKDFIVRRRISIEKRIGKVSSH